MKLQNSSSLDSIVSSRGVGSSSTFGIANNSHMFQILSSGLYSDKIGAVLREVGCNAADAHIFAGKPNLPFQVKLPTKLDRTFYIKDWGNGLDDNEIKHIYSVYGISTKQDCLEQTGGFGLGSKSPFAYTLFDSDNPDGFTVISAKNGIQRTYVAHLNDEGSPVVSQLDEQPASADWPSGVQVMFPVQDRDIAEFHRKAVEIFQWFSTLPEVLGLSAPLSKPEFKLDTPFFKMTPLNGGTLSRESPSAVLMSNVKYPISTERMGDLTDVEKQLLNAGVLLLVDNGAVVMTPSRESLQYTERTRGAILTSLKLVGDTIASRIIEQYQSLADSELSRLRALHSYVASLPSSVHASIPQLLLDNGFDATVAARIKTALLSRVIELPTFVGSCDSVAINPSVTGVVDSSAFKVRAWHYYEDLKGLKRTEILHGKTRQGTNGLSTLGIDVKEACFVIYADGAKFINERVFNLMNSKGRKSTVIFLNAGKSGTFDDAKQLAEKLADPAKGIGGVIVKAASELALSESFLLQQQSLKDKKARNVAATHAQLRSALRNEEVLVYDVANRGMLSMKLGDLTASGMYYTWQNQATRALYETNSAKGIKLSIGRYGSYSFMANVNKMLSALYGEGSSEVITHVVVVENNAALRRLSLNELGFKPLLSHARNVLCSHWTTLSSKFPFVNQSHLASSYVTSRYNALDYPLTLMSVHPLIWETAVANCENPNASILGEISEVFQRLNISYKEECILEATLKEQERKHLTKSSLRDLASDLLESSFYSKANDSLSHNNAELAQALSKEYPYLDLISNHIQSIYRQSPADSINLESLQGYISMLLVADKGRRNKQQNIAKTLLTPQNQTLLMEELSSLIVGDVTPLPEDKSPPVEAILNAA